MTTLPPIHIDFTDPKILYRLRPGAAKKHMLTKACGLHDHKNLRIIDACAGFGTDGLLLASMGATVTLIERQDIIFSALKQALKKASFHPSLASIAERMTLLAGDSIELIWNLTADVIYIDPMFPKTTKTALSNKNMQLLQHYIGSDDDTSELLDVALKKARYRVVVKRPRKSDCIAHVRQPHFQLTGKANRFDIYVNEGLKKN